MQLLFGFLLGYVLHDSIQQTSVGKLIDGVVGSTKEELDGV